MSIAPSTAPDRRAGPLQPDRPAQPDPRTGPLHGVLHAALLALYPPVDDLPGLSSTRLDPFLRKVYAETPRTVWGALILCALILHLSPPLTILCPLPMALLPDSWRDRHVDRFCASWFYPFKQAGFLLKTFGGACWGADPQVRARLGQPPLEQD